MNYRFGKLPARPDAIKHKFGSFFHPAELPTPTLVFGRPDLIKDWGMLANDRHSCCVFSGALHETMLWRAWSGAEIPTFTDANVLSDYSAVTGYDPNDPSTDRGADMQRAASYRKKIGIIDAAGQRHKVAAYVSLKAGDVDQLALAAFMFGAVGLGVEMPSNAMDQFEQGEPWNPVSGSRIEGGHYIPVIGRNHAGNFLIVTWGRLHAITPAFVSKYMDEGVVYLSLEQLRGTGLSPRGFDKVALAKALNEV